MPANHTNDTNAEAPYSCHSCDSRAQSSVQLHRPDMTTNDHYSRWRQSTATVGRPCFASRALKSVAACLVCGLSMARCWSVETPVPSPWCMEQVCRSMRGAPCIGHVRAAAGSPKASFAQNWYVAGIGRLQDEDFVSVKSRDLSSQFTLRGREPGRAKRRDPGQNRLVGHHRQEHGHRPEGLSVGHPGV